MSDFLKKTGAFFGSIFSWVGNIIVKIFGNLISETEKELKSLDASDANLLIKLCRDAAEYVAANVTSDKWQDKLSAGHKFVDDGLKSAGLMGVGTHLIIKLLIAAVSDLRVKP